MSDSNTLEPEPRVESGLPGAAPARPAKKGRRGFNAKGSSRTWLTCKVPHEVYYAVLAEAKRHGPRVRTNDVVAAILKRWHADCIAADRARAARGQ